MRPSAWALRDETARFQAKAARARPVQHARMAAQAMTAAVPAEQPHAEPAVPAEPVVPTVARAALVRRHRETKAARAAVELPDLLLPMVVQVAGSQVQLAPTQTVPT